MSLSIREKETVQLQKCNWIYSIDKKGAPLYKASKSSDRPNYESRELKQMILDMLKELGYKVYFVKPQSANCIIRVYKDEKTYKGDGATYRILGAKCYTKTSNGKWCSNDETVLDFAQHIIRVWFFQDEYWDVSVDFFDAYVKLVKDI